LDPKPVRVCDSCYIKLNKGTTKGKWSSTMLPKCSFFFPQTDSRSNQRDSSDSDGEESNAQYSHTPVCNFESI